MKIKKVMTSDCVTVTKDTTIFDAAVLMKQHDIGMIPVVDQGKLIGIITDRDLVIRGIAKEKEATTPVDGVMSREELHTVSADEQIEEAAKRMAKVQVRRLPVIDDMGNLCGIVALSDLAVRKKLEDKAGEALSSISEPANQ